MRKTGNPLLNFLDPSLYICELIHFVDEQTLSQYSLIKAFDKKLVCIVILYYLMSSKCLVFEWFLSRVHRSLCVCVFMQNWY